ncbi:MAG: retropepsin-like aspartic protease family protein [Thiobacillaceae bacterium]
MVRALAVLCLFVVGAADAQTSVTISGVMGDKALVSVNGGAPRVVRPGESVSGVRLVGIGPQGVEIVLDGRSHVLAIGHGVHVMPGKAVADAATAPDGRVVLTADGRGHFSATGTVNGLPVRFMVDTGASLVSLPSSIARQAGVNLSEANPVVINTANGRARAQRVVINSLKLGQISANLVEALVVEDAALSQPLLGMSFLNRTNMLREGDTLVLTQRY